MGFSVTATHVIFFLAFLSVGSIAMNGYWKTQAELEGARRVESARAASLAHTNITVTSVDCSPASCDAITSITIHVHNGGGIGLNTTAWSYLLDGTLSSSTPTVVITDPAFAITGTTELILPGEDAAITLPVSSTPNSLKIEVVAENGAAAYWSVA